MRYPTLRFVFDRKKTATKKHKASVQIEVLSERKRKYIGTGVKLYSDQWDERKKVINSMQMLELNRSLDEQIRTIQDWVNELIRKREPFDFEKLERFIKFSNKSENFIEFIERRIEERQDITESTKKTHRTFSESLRAFGRITYFSDLTKENITIYDDWLHEKGYSQPTVHNYHKRMKRYINEAIKFELIDKDPYSGLHFERGKHQIRKYLTEDELKKIIEAEIPSKTVRQVRDLFVFQSYTGISYADLAKFDFKKDITKKNGKMVIHDVRQKTEETYFIVLLSPALEVLEKYKFILPVISNQQYNLRLKIVADYAKIDKNLTVHMARHTFATMCLNNGVKIENVSKMLGHSNIKTTQEYAKVLNSEVEKSFDLLESKIKK
nr:MAG TPA: Integrase [Caudoviricetes sp.]